MSGFAFKLAPLCVQGGVYSQDAKGLSVGRCLALVRDYRRSLSPVLMELLNVRDIFVHLCASVSPDACERLLLLKDTK